MSAGHHFLLLLVQDMITQKTRVLAKYCNNQTSDPCFYYVQSVKCYEQQVISHEGGEKIVTTLFPMGKKWWYEICDFQNMEDWQVDEENIIFTSCANYSITFISNKGRIFASGSNTFGECAQPVVGISSMSQHQVLECRIEQLDHWKERPFFVRSVNGDHSIIALTRDHRVFYCGCLLGQDGSDLELLREFNPMGMDTDEYFVDIASCSFSTLILTNKNKLFLLETHTIIEWKPNVKIVTCRIFSTSQLFFIVVNDSKIFSYESSVKECNFVLNNQKSHHHSHLCITGGEIIVMYWKKLKEESKSIQNMHEKLSHSLSVDFLLDVTLCFNGAIH
nr:unnamed protein product [Naegleria fowleri]